MTDGADRPGYDELVRQFYEHRERTNERNFQFLDEMRQRMTAHETVVAQRLAAHESAVSEKIASRLKVYGWVGAAAVAAGVIAMLLGYVRAEHEFHDAFRARLDEEFSAPKVQSDIEDAARRAAESVARVELRPQVDEARKLVQDVKESTQETLEPIRRSQPVTELQGRAAALQRYAFEELRRLKTESDDETVRALALGAYLSIGSAYQFIHFRDDIDLESTDADGVVRRNGDIPTDELLQLLTTGTESQRGKAASWLARKGYRCAVPGLMRLVSRDAEPHLIALRHEAEAVRQLVPGISPSVNPFDVDPGMSRRLLN